MEKRAKTTRMRVPRAAAQTNARTLTQTAHRESRVHAETNSPVPRAIQRHKNEQKKKKRTPRRTRNYNADNKKGKGNNDADRDEKEEQKAGKVDSGELL